MASSLFRSFVGVFRDVRRLEAAWKGVVFLEAGDQRGQEIGQRDLREIVDANAGILVVALDHVGISRGHDV